MRDARKRSGNNGAKELGGIDLFLWRRTDWRGQRWLEDVCIHGSPAGLTRVAESLRRMLEHPPTGTCRFRARPATRADVARIFHETDHRTKKSTKKAPFAGFEVEEELRKAGARMEWLYALTVQWSSETYEATLTRSGREVLIRAGTETVQNIIDHCESQAAGWGNDGCFGARLSCGLTFAPDWLGIE